MQTTAPCLPVLSQGPVLKPWLEKGYELALTPVADARKQQDLVVKEEAIWVTEKEEHDQVLFRLAALANPASFPPRVRPGRQATRQTTRQSFEGKGRGYYSLSMPDFWL